jgi:uncharacterized MAPEG superfamily protein
MTGTLKYVAYAAVLTWLSIMIASFIRARAWTPAGIRIAFGNRNDLPPATELAGRAERTARNTLENFVLFAALALAAQAAGANAAQTETGAAIFFWSRVAFVPVYLLGIIYLRTAIWAVSLYGLWLILKGLI